LAQEAWTLDKETNEQGQDTHINPEYQSWYDHCVLELAKHRQMVEKAEEADDKSEGHQELSALELLRLISIAACPPQPRGAPPLSDEERRLAESILEDGNPSEVMVDRFNVQVTRKQLACLRPGEWLNDEVINFYCKLLQERGKLVKGAPKCWFANSFFWQKLSGANNSNYSYKEVRRWTVKAKIDVFELDHVIFPINIGESHWALGAIDLKEKGFRYFDSMFCRPHKNFAPFLRQYLQDEHKAKKGAPFEGEQEWELIIPNKPLPQQNNGYDCGVFTCFFADCFSHGKDLNFDQDDMPNLRLRLAARVVNGTEDWDLK